MGKGGGTILTLLWLKTNWSWLVELVYSESPGDPYVCLVGWKYNRKREKEWKNEPKQSNKGSPSIPDGYLQVNFSKYTCFVCDNSCF